MECCLFCNFPEKNYKPAPDTDFICGSCAQVLLSTDQDELRRAHPKAVAKGYMGKAEAIEPFIEIGGTNEQRKPETKIRRRHPNRKGIARPARNKKERIGRIPIQAQVAVL